MSITDRPINNSIIYDEYGSQLVLNDGLVGVEPVWSQIGRNVLTGHAGHNGGYVGTSSTATVFVRASTWADPGSEGQVEFVSSSNQDGAAGNQGTLSLRFVYYDGNMNGPFTEDIDLNGTSAVSSVATNVRFLEKMYSLTVGSNGVNVGTITCRTPGGGSTTLGTINAGEGTTFWAHHLVGAGRTCFIREINAGFTSTGGMPSAQIIPRTFDVLTTDAFECPKGASLPVATGNGKTFHFSTFVVPGPTLFVVRVRPDTSTSATTFVNISFYDV